MKTRLLLILLLLASGGIFAQDDIILLFETPNPVYGPEFILGDVGSNDINTIGQTEIITQAAVSEEHKEGEGRETAIQQISFGSSVLIGSNIMAYSLPFSYGIPFGGGGMNSLTLGVSVPYIFSRKISYTEREAKTSGLGDIMVNTQLGVQINSSLKVSLSIGAKLPTGDKNAVDGDLLVPLGTGSTDYYIGTNLSIKPGGSFLLGVNGFYRIGGTTERIYQEQDETQEITKVTNEFIEQGNMFGTSVTAVYPAGWGTLFVTPTYVHILDGEIESTVKIGERARRKRERG